MKSGTGRALGKRKLQQQQPVSQQQHNNHDEQKEQVTPNTLGSDSSDSEQSSTNGHNNSDDDAIDECRYSARRAIDSDEHEEEEEFKIDRKDLLIVKNGTIRVAESLDQQQFDANGEAIKASGTWTQAEHDRFLNAMAAYPKGPWKAIAEMVGSRTVRQTQTHAQKHREKIARRQRGLRNRNGTLQYPPHSFAHAGGSGGYRYSYNEYTLPGSGANHEPLNANVFRHPMTIYADRHHQFPHQQQQQLQTHAFQHQHPSQFHPPPPHVFHPHHHVQHPPQQLQHILPAVTMAPHAAMPSHISSSSSSGAIPHVFASTEFSQLSKRSISRAFLSSNAYPIAWDPQQQLSAALPLAVPPTLARGASWPLSSAASSSSSSESSTTALTVAGASTAGFDPREASLAITAAAASGSASRRRGSDGKVPNFDESMDFLMDVFSGHPSPLRGTQVAASSTTASSVATSATASTVTVKPAPRSQSQSPPQQRRRQ